MAPAAARSASLLLPALVGVLLAAFLATATVLFFGVLLLPLFLVLLGLYFAWLHRRGRRRRERAAGAPVRSERPA